MKWSDMRRSGNVEDTRGGGGRIPGGVGGASIGSVVIAVIAGLIFGVNPLKILSLLQGGDVGPAPQQQGKPIQDRDSDFVKAVLGDTEDTWGRVFKQQLNATYQPPRLVLFTNGVNSACGLAKSATGPFYCPGDDKVYLDMGFFRQIQATAGADADFARAYAIAHEVGHHVQNQLGISTKVRQLQTRSNKATANNLSVRLELQADCFAGIWGHYTAERNLINGQDVKGAMDTAAQIGDDYLQKQSQGYVVPEAFTHGSSEQRVSWFSRGLKSGSLKQCDTFATN
ncbi:MAG: neutral zinc metallopeptidase [Leptolyngbya sp. BL-A-14]